MSKGTLARPEVAEIKSDEQWESDFSVLHDEETERQGKLDETIFAMGDLLVMWHPTFATLTRLSRDYGYTVQTLQERMRTAHEIPAAQRNPKISFSAHAKAVKITDESARAELLANADNLTTNEVAAQVHQKRVELGEIDQTPKAKDAGETKNSYTKARMAALNWAGGFDVSDGVNTVRVRATIKDGQVEITLDNTAPIDTESEVVKVNDGRKMVMTYALQEPTE